MKYIISNIRANLESDYQEIRSLTAQKIGMKSSDISTFRIGKESIDARKKDRITKVFSVIVEIDASLRTNQDIRLIECEKESHLNGAKKIYRTRPVVVGTGPCGLFAALKLAENGYEPLIFDRGASIEKRTELVNKYWTGGNLDTETNVQFGEGGAGTFSDGKLTTRISDSKCDAVLKILRECGAPEEILYKAKPHIGTDILTNVLTNMRKKIESLGGKFHFNTKVTDLRIDNGNITAIEIAGNEWIETEAVILAIGHSSRDTFHTLNGLGILMERKPFSIGVRIEHPQELIDRAQYGKFAGHKALGAADYQLFQKFGKRTAYSFCMCPGGVVVAAASESESIVTNGMSLFARDSVNANSAFVVSVEPGDFEGESPLSGVEFQRKWEKMAFEIGGKSNAAPIQLLEDFMREKPTTKIGTVRPSYTGDVKMTDLNLCLPKYVTDTIRMAIPSFGSKLRGFDMGNAVMTGVETRTSSPVRILRNARHQAIGIEGLYPAGEGAGYAGGIMSAAVDGIRTAEFVIEGQIYT